MYWLFCLHHWKPSDYYSMGYGQKKIVAAFMRQEAEDRKKEAMV